MPDQPVVKKPRSALRRWIRRAFILWATGSTLWLANTMRTQGVDPALLVSDQEVVVDDRKATLEFSPVSSPKGGLVFVCGAGVAAEAYAPLLRPLAEAGYAVYVVRLPYRFAPLPSHKDLTLERARRVVADHPEIPRWVIAGHSLGGALAGRVAQTSPKAFSALVLIGTTHPKQDDLSNLPMAVTKVLGTQDGVAPREKIEANRRLLPAGTKWIEIEGGNHSQFGHYGHQLFDGQPTITRDAQQALTRSALLAALNSDHR
ncbi:MAG: alpha/beta fold hydrolase [Planctomycetales bacterium]